MFDKLEKGTIVQDTKYDKQMKVLKVEDDVVHWEGEGGGFSETIVSVNANFDRGDYEIV